MMNARLKALEAEALQLNVDERAELIGKLIASLEGEGEPFDPKATAAWDIEIARRVEEMEAGRSNFVDAQDVLKNLKLHAAQRRGP